MKQKQIKFLFLTLGILICAGLSWKLYDFFASLDNKPDKKNVVQQITMIRPPPPPPEPPPPPPEPEIEEEIEEEVIEELEDAMPDEMDSEPVGDNLGLDAEGGAGSDGFGLVGRKGGRGIVGGGYAGLIQRELTDLLIEDKELRRREYLFILKVWVDKFGKIERYDLNQKTGEKKEKHLLENALAKLEKLSEAPPLELPQPITLRIRSQF